MIALDLTPYRAVYTSSLTTPCSIWRNDPDSQPGSMVKVKDTLCAINLQPSGGSGSPFISSILRAIQAETPGGRTLSFAWNETVQQADEVRIGSSDYRQRVYNTPNISTGDAHYSLDVVSNDDPMRLGIQVTAQLITANG